MTLLLSTDDTARVMSTRECIDVLEEAYRALAAQEATYRVRSDLVVHLSADEDQTLATMEGAIRPLGVAAIRLRSDHNRRVIRHGVPSTEKYARQPGLFCGLVLLYSLETGEPLAIINDGHLQVMRVGATSALAGKYLARPDSRVLGIIGAGWQAHGHARAYAALFPLREIKVYCRTEQDRLRFAAEMTDELGVEVRAVRSAREAVEGSDIVAPCTDSRVPVLEEAWIADGTYTSSVRYHHELRLENTRRMDLVAVHSPTYGPLYRVPPPGEPADEGVEYGEAKAPLPPNAIPLEQIVGGLQPGRTSPTQRTLFVNNAGKGIQFAALGKVVYDRACEQGLGRDLPTEWFLQDIST
jgi:alanine dehydrogenase